MEEKKYRIIKTAAIRGHGKIIPFLRNFINLGLENIKSILLRKSINSIIIKYLKRIIFINIKLYRKCNNFDILWNN